LAEVYFVSVDLCILWVDQYLLISEDQLTFFRLTLWRNDRHIVPHNIPIEVLLYQDDLLMQRNEECFTLNFIYFRSRENSKFENMVHRIQSRLNYLNLRCSFDLKFDNR
jgi:hypothetical protein